LTTLPPPLSPIADAARRGASVFKMRGVSRHKSMDVLQGYVRDAELFSSPALTEVKETAQK
jgi:hypothetical protein